MRPRTTVILAAVFALLCAGYYATTVLERTWRQRAITQKRLFSFDAGDFRRITVQQEKQRPTVAVRAESGVWRIEQPYELDAHQELWRRVAAHFAELSNERIIDENPSDIAKYELDVPRLTVVGETGDGQQAKAVFGMPGPTGKNRYVQINDGPVLLVNEDAFFELNRSLDLLREFRLFRAGENGISRLEFARLWQGDEKGAAEAGIRKGDESVVVVVERQADGMWRMLEPVQGPADTDAVSRLVATLQSEACKNFVDEPGPLADYGLDPPKVRVTVQADGETTPQTVYFGAAERTGKDPRMFAKRADQPAVFTVSTDLEKLFPASPSAFRERRLLSRKAADIISLRFEAGDERFVLTNDEKKGWVMTDPPVEETDQIGVSSFVADLCRVEGRTFPEPSRGGFGFETPAAVISLQFRNETAPVEIRIGAPIPEARLHYATQDTGAIITIPSDVVDRLLEINSFMFVGKHLLRFKEEEAVLAALRFEGVDYEFERTASVWRVNKPEGKIWESQSAMKALLEAINPVRAEGIEAPTLPGDLAPFGLDAPVLTIEMTVQPGPEQTRAPLPVLRIGALAGDGSSRERYALAEDRPELFRVSQDVIDDVRSALTRIREK